MGFKVDFDDSLFTNTFTTTAIEFINNMSNKSQLLTPVVTSEDDDHYIFRIFSGFVDDVEVTKPAEGFLEFDIKYKFPEDERKFNLKLKNIKYTITVPDDMDFEHNKVIDEQGFKVVKFKKKKAKFLKIKIK